MFFLVTTKSLQIVKRIKFNLRDFSAVSDTTLSIAIRNYLTTKQIVDRTH